MLFLTVFLHSNIHALSSNFEASPLLAGSLLLTLNRTTYLIYRAFTVTAFGHKQSSLFSQQRIRTVRSVH